MKKIWLYLSGVATGVVLMLAINAFTTNNKDKDEDVKDETENVSKEVVEESEPLPPAQSDLNLDEVFFGKETEPGEVFNERSVKILQVITPNGALVNGKDELGDYYGMLYLLLGDEDADFFDDQIVNIPKGKVLRKVGTYHYETQRGGSKTVPKVRIFDKE